VAEHMNIKTNKFPKYRLTPLLLALVLLSISSSAILLQGRAAAQQLSQTMVRLDRLKFSTATSGRVCAKTANAAGVEGKVLVTFPTNSGTDYALAAVGSWTVTTAPLDAGQTAWPGITNATLVSGKTVTFTSGDLSTGILYCFNFAAALTNASTNTETTTGTVVTQTAAAAPIDSGSYSEGLASNGDDSVAITNAIVPPSFTFSLSSNTDSFVTPLSTGSVVSTNGRDVTVSTNAAKGYILYARNAATNNVGGKGTLFSSTANFHLVGTSAVGTAVRTLTNGTPDYGLGVTTFANPVADGLVLNANYDSTASTVKVGTLDPTGLQPIASATGSASADVIRLTERAAISGQTEAATDYGDTITVVGAGLF
jgi:hypothetical protein